MINLPTNISGKTYPFCHIAYNNFNVFWCVGICHNIFKCFDNTEYLK